LLRCSNQTARALRLTPDYAFRALVRHPLSRWSTLALISATMLLAGCESKSNRAIKNEIRSDRAFQAGRYREALKAMQKSLDADENDSGRWLKMGRVREALNLYSGAAAAYQHALDLQPDNLEALQRLAVLAIRGGKYEDAKRYVEPLLVLDPNNQIGLLTAGAIALANREFDTVERISAQIIQIDPNRADGYIMRSRLLDMQGRSGQAARLLEERAKLDPGNADLLLQLMGLYRKMGDRDGIRTTAIRLMPLFPDDPRYAMEAARGYYAQGDTERADQIIDDLRTRYANNSGLMRAIAEFWRASLPPRVAATRIAAAAEKAPIPVRIALARTILSMGEPATAIRLLQPVTTTDVSAATIDAHALMARALLAAGRNDAAEAKVGNVLGFDRKNPEGRLVRARLRLAQGRFREAATDAGVVVADDDGNSEAALLVAQVYAREGKALLAASAFGNARRNFPDDTVIAKAEIDWLIGQRRVDEAVQRASGFLLAHRGSVAAEQLYADTCRSAGPGMCRRQGDQG
jgi:tetratricopeptide (TPR) repeat protein